MFIIKAVKTLSEHWNSIFSKTDSDKLGWYESDFEQTIKFLELISNWQDSKIFVSGAGTTGLVDLLLQENCQLVLNDISSKALAELKEKHFEQEHRIDWLCQDISKPIPELKADIWIDRAVLHFLNDKKDIEQYFKNVDKTLTIGGYAIFAEFSKHGASKCAGLELTQYDSNDLQRHLKNYNLVAEEDYIYYQPSGDPRPYIYTLFQKI